MHIKDEEYLLDSLSKIIWKEKTGKIVDLKYLSYTDWELYIYFDWYKMPMEVANNYEEWDEIKFDINNNMILWTYKRIRKKIIFKLK